MIILQNTKNTKAMIHSTNGKTDFFDIVIELLQGDTLVPYLFLIKLDCILWTWTYLIKENVFTLKKARYPAETITDADYSDDLVLFANTST